MALVLSSVRAGFAADAPAMDLTGSWRLDRTENFDEYLEKSGTSWWKRKLAKLGSSRLRQTIKQDGNRFEIESVNPVETRTDVFVADGVTPRRIETVSGDMMTWTARIEDAALVVDGRGDLGHRIVRRELVDDALVMTIVNPDANARCRLHFERTRSD